MSIVTVKNKYQVVIPPDIREKLGINAGDLLEAKVERGRLTFTPKAIVNRIPSGKAARKRFFEQLRETAPDSIKQVWATSKRNGTDKMTMREINAEIAAYRRERAKKTDQPAR